MVLYDYLRYSYSVKTIHSTNFCESSSNCISDCVRAYESPEPK